MATNFQDILSTTSMYTQSDVNTELQNSTTFSGTTTGTATAYVLTLTPALAGYVSGARFFVKFHLANTTTNPTININGLGVKTITKNGAAALTIGDIALNQIYAIAYDGTNFQLVGMISAGGGGGFSLWRNSYPKDLASTTNTAYSIVAEVIFGGTTALGTPTEIKALLEMSGATNIDIRIYDVTNALVIVEKLANVVPTATIVNLGALSNLSTGQAIWEVHLKRNGGTGSSTAIIHSFQVK